MLQSCLLAITSRGLSSIDIKNTIDKSLLCFMNLFLEQKIMFVGVLCDISIHKNHEIDIVDLSLN